MLSSLPLPIANIFARSPTLPPKDARFVATKGADKLEVNDSASSHADTASSPTSTSTSSPASDSPTAASDTSSPVASKRLDLTDMLDVDLDSPARSHTASFLSETSAAPTTKTTCTRTASDRQCALALALCAPSTPRPTLLALRPLSKPFQRAADAALVHTLIIDAAGVRAPHGRVPREGWAADAGLVRSVRRVVVYCAPDEVAAGKNEGKAVKGKGKVKRRKSIDSDSVAFSPSPTGSEDSDDTEGRPVEMNALERRLGVDLTTFLGRLAPDEVHMRAAHPTITNTTCTSSSTHFKANKTTKAARTASPAATPIPTHHALPRPIVARTLIAHLAPAPAPKGKLRRRGANVPQLARVPPVCYGVHTVVLVLGGPRMVVAPFPLPASVRRVVVVSGAAAMGAAFEPNQAEGTTGDTKTSSTTETKNRTTTTPTTLGAALASARARAARTLPLWLPLPLTLPLSALRSLPTAVPKVKIPRHHSLPSLNPRATSTAAASVLSAQRVRLAQLVAAHLHACPGLEYVLVDAWDKGREEEQYGAFFTAVVRHGVAFGCWSVGDGVWRVVQRVREVGLAEWAGIGGGKGWDLDEVDGVKSRGNRGAARW